MEHAAADQQVIFGMFQPVEEVGDQGWYTFCGRSNMDSLLSGKYTNSAMAEFSCLINQSRHHDAVSFQQVTDREWIKLRKKVVSGDGISDFLNFPEGSNDFFPSRISVT